MKFFLIVHPTEVDPPSLSDQSMEINVKNESPLKNKVGGGAEGTQKFR